MFVVGGYTLLLNTEDYKNYKILMKETYREDHFLELNIVEPKEYPVLIRDEVSGGSLIEWYYVATIESNELKDLYNNLHKIYGEEE